MKDILQTIFGTVFHHNQSVNSIGWKTWQPPKRNNGQLVNLTNHPCKSRQSKRNKKRI